MRGKFYDSEPNEKNARWESTAGFLYTPKEFTDTPTGLTFGIFYRLIDLDLDNVVGGKAGTLKPALGFKGGYVFEGFWTIKDKSAKIVSRAGRGRYCA